jgi:hypothetical protein
MESSNVEQKLQKYLKQPAFFTKQIHEKTLKRQLQIWAEILHYYFCRNNMNEISISELDMENFELFTDKSTKIPKRVSKDFIILIIEEMCEQGKAEWKNLQKKESFFIYTRNLKEIGAAIYKWAQKNGKIGSIETIKWIIEGDDTDQTDLFYQLPFETVLKSLKLFEKETNQIQVFQIGDKYSVKFL